MKSRNVQCKIKQMIEIAYLFFIFDCFENGRFVKSKAEGEKMKELSTSVRVFIFRC